MTTSTDSKPMDAKVAGIMGDITQRVVDAIKAGTAPWQRPWATRFGEGAPANLLTGKHYNGLNALYLRIIGDALGAPYWIGFKQARKLGGNVRKGEKSTAILAPVMVKREDADGREYMFPVAFRVVRVFHVSQCDGLDAKLAEVMPDDSEPRTLDASALDSFIANVGATIKTGGDRACFVPAIDEIHMPDRDQFESAGGYYGTLLHEHIHWTGHKSRIDRLSDKSRRGYAFEELIAELGAYYASEVIGCPNEAENHASYLESWLKALDSDPKYLWQAASQAERAAKYLIACAEKGEKKAA